MSPFSQIILIAISCCAVLGAADTAPQVEARLDATGLASLRWAGHEILKAGTPVVRQVVFETQHQGERLSREFATIEAPEVTAVKVDQAQQRLLQHFAWGTVTSTYAFTDQHLDVTVQIENRDPRTLANFTFVPLELTFPEPIEQPRNWRHLASPPGDLPLVDVRFGTHRVLVCSDTVLPYHIGVDKPAKDGRDAAVVLHGGLHITEPGATIYHPHGLPRIAPGESLTIRLSLRFASAEAETPPLLADVEEAFRAYHQPRMVWIDRRPIGAIFFPTSRGPENNPRNWFKKKDLDVRTDSGKAELRKLMLDFADRTVAQLRATNAQGAIMWNPEGEENPHPISYIGDPRMVSIMAPEVADIIPEFAKRITDAGFRIGTCLRPTQVYQDDKGKWHHGTGSHGPERNPLNDDFADVWPAGEPWWRFYPVAERMSRKIAFAREQWGCTIFYIDTNGVHRGTGEDQKISWTLMDPHIWRDLHQRHPDVLLIPEFAHSDGQYAYTSVYLQPPHSTAVTRPHLQRLLPGTFSVTYTVNLKPDEWEQRREQLDDGVRRGDSMFFRAWFGDRYNQRIKEIFDAIYEPDAIHPGLPEDYLRLAPR